ncbi:MAG: ribonuclease HII [Euryarchaeota archaeon]|nr:ribonuclease HII [Euryarchaeota archaeon]
MSSVVIGVDEAGRGPAIGPLVVSSICIPSGDLLHLESIGAKDSKIMSSKKRTEVESSILRESKKRDWRVCRIPISAKSIDEERAVKSLNSIEIERFVQAILEVSDYDSTGWVHVDLLGNNPSNFSKMMCNKISELRPGLQVKSEVGMDGICASTGAASILAKVMRDSRISEISEEVGFNVGSGYPSDSKTVDAIRILTSGDAPNTNLRWTWSTVSRIWSERHNGPVPIRTSKGALIQQPLNSSFSEEGAR